MKRLHLDQEQTRVLNQIEESSRIIVRGAPGTGKSLLAMEAAARFADRGERVLLLCFTEALADWFDKRLARDDMEIGAVRRFAARLLGETGPNRIMDSPSAYWNEVSLRAAVDGLPPKSERWSAVIVDEGQDFSPEDWDLANECTTPDASLWVFTDASQGFWRNRGLPENLLEGFAGFRLDNPYRCAPAIQNLTDCYGSGCKPDPQILDQGLRTRVLRFVGTSEDRLEKQIEKEINHLISGKVRPSDIAVLSLRGRGCENSVIHLPKIGAHRVVAATDEDAQGNIICDTFLRFKGLERPAVIVTDLRMVRDRYETRMRIAVSRATSLSRIVAEENALKRDPRLAMFQKG